MSSDRARDSYDATRNYRSVVTQQGRVTVEADENEGQRIAEENLLHETLDIVGPCGTPDNGFAVSVGTPPLAMPDFAIGPGTMYVGGLRVTQQDVVKFSHQSEWLDAAGDPLWSTAQGRGNEFVYLFLREQEVTAVEDQVLREVALGGPDTGARTRLVQRIVRTADAASTCDQALADTEQKWAQLGLSFDPKTMRLTSPATLQVKFVQPPVAETQCDPQVQGGYLGADNQMIRVKISAYDPKTRRGKLLWGYNNASFLHRVTVIGSQTLQLVAAPLDTYHAPRSGHAIELLRSAVDLKNDNYVAATDGLVFTPNAAYVPDTRQQVLPSALPASYVKAKGQLFLRLWEFEVPFTSGQAVDLKGTGLQVAITLPGTSGALTVGQYWTFAARPSTPVIIYPQRYLDAPQPAEGPRMWACPLAVIGWGAAGFELISDCRQEFDNLVDLTKRRPCCSVVIAPQDVNGGSGLQVFLDTIARAGQATVSLLPGTYNLPAPLRLNKAHSGLTLEGCHDGAWLVANGELAAFHDGLVILTGANDVTLRRLRFHLPLVQTGKSGVAGAMVTALYDSTGVRAIHCADLHVAECLFRFTLVPDNSIVTATGFRAASDCWNVCLERNRFLHDDGYVRGAHHLIGICAGLEFMPPGAIRRAATSAVTPLLENFQVLGNEFAGLTLASYVRAEMGRVRCQDNRVHGCDGGFYFTNVDGQMARQRLLDAAEKGVTLLYSAMQISAQSALVQAMVDFAKRTPLPKDFEAGRMVLVGKSPSTAYTKELSAQAHTINQTMLDSFAVQTAAATPATGQAQNAAAKTATETDTGKKAALPLQEIGKAEFEAIREQTGDFMVAPATVDETVQPAPAIRFGGNDIDLIPFAQAKSRQSTQPPVALLVGLDFSVTGSVLIDANDIRGNSFGQLMDVQGVMIAAITGNIVVNAHKGDAVESMLVIVPESGVMNAAGNVCRGNFLLLSFPPLLGCLSTDWRFLNSEKPA